MPRNVEIKARVRNADAVRVRAAALSDAPPVVLEQEDTFFRVPAGRLKLRVFPDGKGELIAYSRPDELGPRTSEYVLHRTSDPDSLREVLAQSLTVRGVLRKRRILYLVGRTRVHLDEVEGLGTFLELEVVLDDGEPIAAGEIAARRLLAELGLSDDDLVARAYIDLLEAEEKE